MKFYLVTNRNKDTELEITLKIAAFLNKKGGSVFTDSFLKEAFASSESRYISGYLSEDNVPDDIDAVIVIGGDGTILRAAKRFCKKGFPIVGINLGKIGYMAELEVSECELLNALFDIENGEKVKIDERMMLSCKVIRNSCEVFSGECLNEVVVAKGDVSRMIDLSLSHDGETLADYQCDGVIAATPTGSTAYSMSAGGPIIDPKIECISVLPLSPYLCINSSPIIFSKDSVIELEYRCVRQNSAYVSLDGEKAYQLSDCDKVIISASPYTTKLLRFKKSDFYKLLNAKLASRISELADKI